MSSTDTDRPLYTQDVRIAAPPQVVFGYLTSAELMARWMGVGHTLDPRPEGSFRVDVNGRDTASGTFVAVEPDSRVVFTWGWEGSTEMPPGSSIVEITLTAEDDGTLLHLTHRDCPPGQLDLHAQGWDHYLDRLQRATVGDAGRDPWLDPPSP